MIDEIIVPNVPLSRGLNLEHSKGGTPHLLETGSTVYCGFVERRTEHQGNRCWRAHVELMKYRPYNLFFKMPRMDHLIPSNLG